MTEPFDQGRIDREQLYLEGDLFFSALENAFEKARSEILIEMYIFQLDRLGRGLIQTLLRASARGVGVRVLLDGFGSSSWGTQDFEHLRNHGVQVRIFNPFPWQKSKFNKSGGFPKHWRWLNRRNHRKVIIIDRAMAFFGSLNFDQRHCRRYVGESAWRDLGLRIQGPEVTELLSAFEIAWERPAVFNSHGLKSAIIQSGPTSQLRLNWTRKMRRAYHRERIDRILRARTRIWMVSPYFAPSIGILRALRFSAWVGTDVRLVVPVKNDVFIMKWVNRAFYQFLHRSGMRVFEYQPAMLHEKTLLTDQELALGSSNLNHRSLFYDLEVDWVTADPALVNQIEKRFIEHFSNSQEVFPARQGSHDLLSGFFEFWSRIWQRFLLSWRHWF